MNTTKDRRRTTGVNQQVMKEPRNAIRPPTTIEKINAAATCHRLNETTPNAPIETVADLTVEIERLSRIINDNAIQTANHVLGPQQPTPPCGPEEDASLKGALRSIRATLQSALDHQQQEMSHLGV